MCVARHPAFQAVVALKEGTIAEQSATTAEQAATIAEQVAAIGEHAAAILQRDRTIADQVATIAEQANTIAELQRQLVSGITRAQHCVWCPARVRVYRFLFRTFHAWVHCVRLVCVGVVAVQYACVCRGLCCA